MPSESPFKIRPASMAKSDHELLVDFQDSQIAWLTSVGSGGQWGTEPIRGKHPKQSDKSRAWIERSEKQAPWSSEWCRVYVAEANDGTPVAGLALESKSNPYIRTVLSEQDENDPFVYLAYLISNRNAGEATKEVGSALIAFAKEQTLGLGLKRICVDCWSGNDRKLVKYYESQGFVPIGDFTDPEKNWSGCVLEMRL